MVCMYNFLANSLSWPASEVGAISQSLQVAKNCVCEYGEESGVCVCVWVREAVKCQPHTKYR